MGSCTKPTTAIALARRYRVSAQYIGELRRAEKLHAEQSGGVWIYDQQQADRYFAEGARKAKERGEELLARIGLADDAELTREQSVPVARREVPRYSGDEI